MSWQLSISVYKRGSTWYYDVKVGRRRERKRVGLDKAEAKQREKEARARLTLQIDGVKKAPAFRDFAMIPDGLEPQEHILLTTYLDGYAKLHKKSWKRDEQVLTLHLIPEFGDLRLDQIGTGDINAFIAKRQQAEAADATIALEINCLKAIYRYARQLEYVERSPVHGKKLATRPINNQRERYLTYEEYKKLYESAAEHLQPILIVAVQTGMRAGELVALEWVDIDFGQNRILVKHSKNGRSRKIPISEEVKQVLMVLQNRQYHPCRVFAYRDGRPVTNFRTAWLGALKRAKLENDDIVFHSLRHTFATHAAQAGAPPEVLKELLGHSTLAMVLRYSHMTDDRMERAIEGVAGRLEMDKLTTFPGDIRDTSGAQTAPERKVASL